MLLGGEAGDFQGVLVVDTAFFKRKELVQNAQGIPHPPVSDLRDDL